MAQLKDIIDVENSRLSFESQRAVHLFPEGTFYRAYEWSAWLCSRYMGNLKATHRQYKNVEQTVVFVGFPQTSLQKFVPEGSTLKEETEGRLDVLLSRSVGFAIRLRLNRGI